MAGGRRHREHRVTRPRREPQRFRQSFMLPFREDDKVQYLAPRKEGERWDDTLAARKEPYRVIGYHITKNKYLGQAIIQYTIEPWVPTGDYMGHDRPTTGVFWTHLRPWKEPAKGAAA